MTHASTTLGDIIHFPTTAAYVSHVAALQSDARIAEVLTAAPAILRSAHRHSDDTLTYACEVLRAYGDENDHMEADAMMLAIRLRRNRRAHEAAEAQPGMIRGALFDAAVFAVAAVAMLVVALAGP